MHAEMSIVRQAECVSCYTCVAFDCARSAAGSVYALHTIDHPVPILWCRTGTLGGACVPAKLQAPVADCVWGRIAAGMSARRSAHVKPWSCMAALACAMLLCCTGLAGAQPRNAPDGPRPPGGGAGVSGSCVGVACTQGGGAPARAEAQASGADAEAGSGTAGGSAALAAEGALHYRQVVYCRTLEEVQVSEGAASGIWTPGAST